MENKNSSAYRVFVHDSALPGPCFCLYDAATIDEACAFGLMLFRSSNVPDIDISIFNQTTNSDVVVFSKAAKSE